MIGLTQIAAWRRKRRENQVEGEKYLTDRNWSEAEKYLTLALAESRHSSKERLDLLLGLTEAQREQGKTAEAAQTTQTAIELAVSSKNKIIEARALDALADIQLDQKNYTGVEKTIARIEALELSMPQPDHKRIAGCARKLAMTFVNSGRPEEAMKAFERLAQLSEKAFGAEHFETAEVLTELGERHRKNGDHAEAQRCLQKALDIHRTTSGVDSQEATQDLFYLASSLEESGDVDGAAAQYERVLAVRERQIGADREQTAETQAHLAAIYLRADRTSAARELLIHSIGVLGRKKGDERLEFALETMASVEDELNRPVEAERWREKAAASLAIRTGVVPEVVVPVKQLPKYY
ncbi:MAG: tetratricopeptide repeat protein [Bryobacteraceae bacterium]